MMKSLDYAERNECGRVSITVMTKNKKLGYKKNPPPPSCHLNAPFLLLEIFIEREFEITAPLPPLDSLNLQLYRSSVGLHQRRRAFGI
jgi:hypothetical protein